MDMQATTLWENACDHLKGILNPDVFSRWISVITPLEMKNDALGLQVENDFFKTWLEEHYLQLIVTALRASGAPETLRVTFAVRQQEDAPETVEGETTTLEPEKKPKKKGRGSKGVVGATLNERYTFDEYVIGPSNSFAHAAALAVAQSPGTTYNPLFIYGQSGLGKTHLIQAVGHYVLQKQDNPRVVYTTTESMMNEYVAALQARTLPDFRNRYRNVDVLLLDDIHFLSKTERLQEEFFHTFNALFDARKQIIMTSDRPASEITKLERRLVTRFEWGLVTELDRPDFETRRAILLYKQKTEKVRLEDTLFTFIVENVKSNVRSLEGAWLRAISYAKLHPTQKLTTDFLRILLKDLLDKEHQQELTFDDIQRAVAEHYDIRLADMTSKRRPRSVALPRQIAMYLSRKLTSASLQEIAESFGKTHATVLHGVNAIQNRIDTEDKMHNDVRMITRKLGRDPITY